MKDTSLKKTAGRRNAAPILTVIIVAAFTLTYVLWPWLASPPAPLFVVALLLVVWLYAARRRAEATARRQALQLGSLAELGRRALSGVNVSEFMNVAVSVVARRTGAESAVLWEVLPGGWFMSVRASVGWTDEFLAGATADLGAESMLSRALDSAEPVIVTDHTPDPHLAEPPHLRREARSCVSVAVRRGQAGFFGVLSVYTDEPKGFTDGDVHFIQAVANVLSSAVMHEKEELERARISLSEEEARRAVGLDETNAERLILGCAGHVG